MINEMATTPVASTPMAAITFAGYRYRYDGRLYRFLRRSEAVFTPPASGGCISASIRYLDQSDTRDLAESDDRPLTADVWFYDPLLDRRGT